MELTVKSLTKGFGGNLALDHISITLSEGIYGILGPNGAGKSTFMNILTDNLKRDSGDIMVDGQEVLKLGKEYRRMIGYMPQQQGLYEEFTAYQFVYYMAGIKGIKKKEAVEEIGSLLEVVGLSNVAHRKVGGFSGGMKQRLLLICALLGNPKILILDEPTAGLDPEERIRIRNFISELSMERIVIVATHVVGDIESIADNVILMNKGKIVGMDTPLNLITSIEGKVAQVLCNPDEVKHLQKQYQIGNVYQSKDGLLLRIVGDNLPTEFERVSMNLGLEDAYLYYLKGRN